MLYREKKTQKMKIEFWWTNIFLRSIQSNIYFFILYVKKWLKDKTKDGKKLKKKKQSEEPVEQEDPDCEPPAPKKKKKKDKLAVDQENGHTDEAIDMNGNSHSPETPKQKTKKKSEGDTEVSAVLYLSLG